MFFSGIYGNFGDGKKISRLRYKIYNPPKEKFLLDELNRQGNRVDMFVYLEKVMRTPACEISQGSLDG